MFIKKIISLFLLLVSTSIFSQTTSLINIEDSIQNLNSVKQLKFNYKQLIIPATVITFGLIGIESDQIKSYNAEISEEVTEHIDKKITVDDFCQYVPAASVYAVGAIGIKGKNNIKNKTIILTTSFLIMSLTVTGLKHITKVERPDGSANNSFPSGHTANAFMGAEFLYQEYKNVSVWYGISGYAIATFTGAFRVYNNRHWLTDVAAGAGIGILSAKAAYWLFPTINKLLATKTSPNKKSAFVPYYDGKQIGFGYVSSF